MTTNRVDDGAKASAVVLAVAFAGFSTFLDLYATQPLLPRFTDTFHASKAEVGLTVSAATAAVALSAPIFGILGDRFRRSTTMVVSLCVLALTTLLAATSETLPTLIFWRFLQGVATPGVYVSALAYLSEEVNAAFVGRAMAAFVTGNVIGGWAGRTATGVIAAHTHWSRAFLFLGLLNALGALVTWRFLPPSRAPATGVAPEPIRARLAKLWTPALLVNLLIGFNVLFSLVSVFSFVGFHLVAPPFGLATSALSTVFSVYLVGALATPVAGRLIDRAGTHRVLLGALAVGAAGVLLTLVPSLPVVVIGLALMCSACFACQSASTTRLRSSAPPGLRSLASGAYVTAYYLGGSAGGIAPAYAWQLAGWKGCVILTVCVQLLTMALAQYFWSPRRAISASAS